MSSKPAPKDEATTKTWFDHMTGYLKWKVLGPDIHNPFKSPFPIHLLYRMVNNRDYLNQHIQVRCMCDGYEVMIISNPYMPRITSNHPCVSGMDRGDIVDYIRRQGLDLFIDAEIDRIHDEIANYVKTREDELDKDERKSITKKTKPSKERKEESHGKNYRIVRR